MVSDVYLIITDAICCSFRKRDDIFGQDRVHLCLLPVMVGDQLQKGALEVSVLHSADKWFGMTYHEDREIVAEELRKLHARGDYPESLRV